ncbi:MAG: glycosyltransferase family 2 protein [Acidimicrobiales bacterium]
MAGSQLVASLRRSAQRERRRKDDLREFVLRLGEEDFDRRHPGAQFAPVLVLVAAYLEAENIGDVLKGIPSSVEGLGVSTLVVVDGGNDGTEDIASGLGAFCAVLPVNMGHGVALRLGYRLAAVHGARYVVTIDADGQNDPAQVPVLVAPLLEDRADFVIGSRRLGSDATTDPVRRAGVVFFSAAVNLLTGQHLTDTSNGARALKIEVLQDVVLEQDQYQTAELIISAASRGWRLSETPEDRQPRAHGESKKGHNALFAFHYARVILRTWWRERR